MPVASTVNEELHSPTPERIPARYAPRRRNVAKLGPGHSAQTGAARQGLSRVPLMLLAAQMYDALGVPAHPRATTAPTIRPEQLPSSANRSFYKQRILQAETCGLDAAYSTSAKFNVSKCAHIEVSTLSEGQSCEDFYSREHLFTICRSRDTANPLTCESGVTFSCWVPGISNLASAQKAGIRSAHDPSDECEDCLVIGPWLVPPGYAAYPDGADGQPAVYPVGVCPVGCNPAGTAPWSTAGTAPWGTAPWTGSHLAAKKTDAAAEGGEWEFCWCTPANVVSSDEVGVLETPDKTYTWWGYGHCVADGSEFDPAVCEWMKIGGHFGEDNAPSSVEYCENACNDNPGCQAFTYKPGDAVRGADCFLYNDGSGGAVKMLDELPWKSQYMSNQGNTEEAPSGCYVPT